MPCPEFSSAFPGIAVPFPTDVVQSSAIRSDDALVVFFAFLQDITLPRHSHGAQWGTIVAGEIEFPIGDATRTYRPGDSCSIPAGGSSAAPSSGPGRGPSTCFGKQTATP